MNSKHACSGILALTLLGLLITPYHAAAQTGTKTYEVTLTNITTGKQALSPVVIAAHSSSAHAWQMGKMASKGLELLAEDGKPDALVSELHGVATDVQSTHSHLMPGDSITLRITAKEGDVLSAATMLIQTNDGFTGLDSVPLTVGDRETIAYDAGTEDNSEIKADIPGFYGPLHGPDTTPHQPISMHQGITGKAEVTPDFNWSGPVARFSVREVAPTTVMPGTYEVTLTNITTGKQALSPVVLATHPASAHAWQMGKMASKGLELLAEDGKPDMFANELRGMTTDVAATHAHLMPGDSITLNITAKDGDVLSAATMLIQTNDGFTGLDSVPLVAGNTDAMIYDAGTEDNSELKIDIPGFYGALHGPDTTPHQPISLHQGITGRGEVTPDFGWSEPVARFTIRTMDTTGVMPMPNDMPSGMPHTGSPAPDTTIWLIGVLAAVLAVGGFTLRRSARVRS